MTSVAPIAAASPASAPAQPDAGNDFGKLIALETDRMQTWASDNADTYYGGPSDNAIYGGGGNDFIDGGRGNDDLQGDTGNDVLRGGNGDDDISGFAGSDELYGDNGADNIDDVITLSDNETLRVNGGSSSRFSPSLNLRQSYQVEDQDTLSLSINGTGTFVIDERGNSGVFDFKYANGQGSLSGRSIGTVEDIERLKINYAEVDLRDGQTFRVNQS
jgi:Ca2+-binding RTX toxin-like protein